MASEEGRFTVTDVIEAINEKLVRRHPHVFGDRRCPHADDVVRIWVRIKAEERRDKDDRSAIAGVPLQCRPSCARTGWEKKPPTLDSIGRHVRSVLNKVREEIAELEEAIEGGDKQATEMELGDLLFATTSVARHLDVNAEDALGHASDRFSRRFRSIEDRLPRKVVSFARLQLPRRTPSGRKPSAPSQASCPRPGPLG